MIERIFVSSDRGGTQLACAQAQLDAGMGIAGDRYFGVTKHRAQNITLVEAEQIERFCGETGRPLEWSITRRNVVTRGVRLNELVGKRFTLGEVTLLGVELCEPCALLGSRLADDALEPASVVARWLGCAGLRADIVASGWIRCGDRIELIGA